MSRRTIITGGAGFIGSHLASALIAKGRRVLILDDLSTGRKANLAHLPPDSYQLIQGRAGETLTRHPEWLEEADQVYHLAAAVGVRLVVNDPLGMIRNNVEDSAKVLDAVARRGIPVLIASSSEVYGRSLRMPLQEDQETTYGPTTSPRWAYALTKALDEHMALQHARKGLGVIIVRLFNTIGPRQIGQYGMVVPRFIRWALDQAPLEIHGDGRQTRAFCDVRDVTAAMIQLLDRTECHGRVYNLGSDREITIQQLAQQIISLAASRSICQFIPYEQTYHPGFEDPVRRVPDLTRIKQAIGFTPGYTLEQTLSELIALASSSTSPSATSI